MSDNLFSQLLKQSDEFSKPCVIPHFFDDKFLSLNDIAKVINQACQHPDRERLIRVFDPKGESAQQRIMLINQPPVDRLSLKTWWKKTFIEKRHGAIFYKVDQYSSVLQENIAQLCQQIFTNTGYSQAGIDTFLFVGDYGYSPVGIHKDREQGITLHLHFGPGEKEMLVWSEEEYLALTGSSDVSYDAENLRANAQVFKIPAYSAFVLPPGGYHIGYTPDFSIGLAITLVLPARIKVLDYVMQSAIELLPIEHNEILAPLVFSAKPDEHMIDLFGENKPDMNKIIEQGCTDYYLSLKSNAGLNNVLSKIPELPDRFFHCSYQRIAPFTIYYQQSSQDIILYIRRKKIFFPVHLGIISIIELINRDVIFSPASLSYLLNDEWEDDVIEYFFEQLFYLGAITSTKQCVNIERFDVHID